MMSLLYLLAIPLNALGDRLRGGLLPNKYQYISAGLTGAIIFTVLFMWVTQIPYDYALLHMKSNISLIPSFDVWLAPLVLIGYWIGESWGWGEPLGAFLGKRNMEPADYEWWQKGILKYEADTALVVRGAMWGFPTAIPLYFYDPLLALTVFVGYTLGMLAGPITANHYWPEKNDWWRWGANEYIRGAYVMALIVLYVLIT